MQIFLHVLSGWDVKDDIIEPLHDKTNNLDFRPALTQTSLYSHRGRLCRSLRFWIKEDAGLYYLFSKNEGSDQLCSYCTADLRLCFCLYMLLAFLFDVLYYFHNYYVKDITGVKLYFTLVKVINSCNIW